ncbi:MAG: hypothetical protein H6734_00315 [Alphaproteobacteria bacterium]|nr:hypothetical protein [Alphaproteobacteria bacterium]
MIIAWIAAALAGPTEVELARDLLASGRPDAAFATLRPETADGTDPTVWLTFLETCEAVGLGVACRAEVAVRGDAEPDLDVIRQWYDRVHHGLVVEAAEGAGELGRAAAGVLDGLQIPDAVSERMGVRAHSDPDAAAEEAMLWIAEHPDHPDVLLPLFASDIPPRASLGKARKAIEKVAKKQLKRTTDAAVALRWHRLLKGMGSELRATWADKVVALGQDPPLAELPMSRAEQVKRAAAVLAGEAEIPSGIPADQENVALKLADQAAGSGRTADAVKVLAALMEANPTINVSLALTQAHLDLNDPAAAAKEAERAIRLAVAPWPTDVAGADRIFRRIALSKALAARGEARLRGGELGGAVTDLMVANQLAIEPVRADQLEKAMDKGRYTLESVKVQLDTPATPAQTVALQAAKKALDAGDTAGAVASATQAIEVLCLPTHKRARLTATLPSIPEMASAFALRGLAHLRAGDREAAHADLSTAVLLVPWAASSDWWAELAGLREGDAGLLAASLAERTSEDAEPGQRAVTARPADPAVSSAVTAALVSAWMRGHEKLEEGPGDGLKITRGRVIAFRAPRTGGGGGGGKARAPALNTPFPNLVLHADGGTVTLQAGRIHLVSFVRLDSPTSQRLLTDMTVLARNMRARGLDVVSIGVSMDKEESALAAAGRQRDTWGTVAWDPGLGESFGVTAVPTTWVVDASGIARFVHVGYLGPSVYEEEVRYVSAR